MRKLCLVIIDGWGHNEEKMEKDPIRLTVTKELDSLKARYPHCLLEASGTAVGLPDKMMGNSEVGHLTIGSGRIVKQELLRINEAIERDMLKDICRDVGLLTKRRIHLVGLVSDGGIHSHIHHFKAFLNILKDSNKSAFIHCISDGRDTSPTCFLRYYDDLAEFCRVINFGMVVSVAGRAFTMDRAKIEDRTEKAFKMMTDGKAISVDVLEHINKLYAKGISDEYFEPFLVNEMGLISKDDPILFLNFRADRMRQIVSRFIENRNEIYTLTSYAKEYNVNVLFKPMCVYNTLAEVVAKHNLCQTHIAEREKYAHVTYFFNGGSELPNNNEKRIVVESPSVPSYDMKPEMSMHQVTNGVIMEVESEVPFVMCNLAAPDMVGHTGVFEAACKAVLATDECIGKIYEVAHKNGYVLVITADHGNVEVMVDHKNQPSKKHTCNKVPFIVCDYLDSFNLSHYDYSLRDVAPTILQIIGLDIPEEMDGRSLF